MQKFTHFLKPVFFTVKFSDRSSRSARLLACNFSHWRTKSLQDHGVQLCAWGATTARSVSRSCFRFGAVSVVVFAMFQIEIFPLSPATSVFSRIAPTTSRYFIGIAWECHHEWPHQGPLHFVHCPWCTYMFIGNFPFNFSRRHRSDSNFLTAPWSWLTGDGPVCARSRCTRQTNQQRHPSLRRWRCSWNVSHTIVVGRSTSGSYCVSDMLQARDKFGVMGWRKYIKFVSQIKRHVQWTALAWKNGNFTFRKISYLTLQSLTCIVAFFLNLVNKYTRGYYSL